MRLLSDTEKTGWSPLRCVETYLGALVLPYPAMGTIDELTSAEPEDDLSVFQPVLQYVSLLPNN